MGLILASVVCGVGCGLLAALFTHSALVIGGAGVFGALGTLLGLGALESRRYGGKY